MSVLAIRPYAAIHTSVIDLIQDHCLVQAVTQPTQFQNILDLFLMNYPNELHDLHNIIPGMSDHNIVNTVTFCMSYSMDSIVTDTVNLN